MKESRSGANIAKASYEGILTAVRANPTKPLEVTGYQTVKFDKNREALMYIPENYNREKASPFALMLHGAGGSAQHGISYLQHLSDKSGIILLAPKSLEMSWDVIVNDYGTDVEFINAALEYAFDHFNIDESRLAIGGFSDGASYALSLGLINGELFTHVIAYSPGFMAVPGQSGNPRIFISHGTEDGVLPIEKCSRKLVPQLKRGGYDVLYKEFEGPHTIPLEISEGSVEWFLGER
jgi:phospholipase/carboxylesterase